MFRASVILNFGHETCCGLAISLKVINWNVVDVKASNDWLPITYFLSSLTKGVHVSVTIVSLIGIYHLNHMKGWVGVKIQELGSFFVLGKLLMRKLFAFFMNISNF